MFPVPVPVFAESVVADRSQTSTRPLAPVSGSPIGRRKRLRRHRELIQRDRVAAQLAELHSIRALLTRAADTVAYGWLQNSWFAWSDANGRRRSISAHNLHQLDEWPVTGACLVGAIVHAGGGRSNAGSQLVQRTLDVTWHALYRDAAAPVAWCPSPDMRMAHVRDLTTWNDRAGRRREDVTALLGSADRIARNCITRLRA